MTAITTDHAVRPTLPPGPPPLPLVGNIPQVRRNQLSFFTGVQRAYGDLATIHLGRQPFVLLSRPAYVHSVLVERARDFTSGSFNQGLRHVLGDGLLTTDGDFHRQQRRLVQPAFHKKRVESYAATMVAHTEEMLATWRPGEQRDVAHAMRELTLRIVARALFDLELRGESAWLDQAFTNVIENPVGMRLSLRQLPLDLPFTPYGRHMEGRRRLDRYVFGLIAERRAEGRDHGDVLSTLLEAQDADSRMTDRQVRDQTMTLLAAGHETTANALAWTFYLLSENPVILERLLAELTGVLGGRAPTLADLPGLPYLDGVVSEVLRLYPPAWMIGRRATAPFELGGYQFAAGTMVMMSQWVIHRLPDLWGDPLAFRPERWAPEQARALPPGAYFPFGAGPRICIGMPFAQLEARLLLATILQRFAPRLVAGWPVVPRPRVTLRPKYGLRMVLEPSRVPRAARR